jgi:glutamyl-tRNA synthetase
MIRTRFAPSPTGYLHIGGLRTALYAYLLAKQQHGKFLLRIEDTDRERYVADGTLNILKSLTWAQLTPDEGVKLDTESAPGESQIIQEGESVSYIQSERLEIYQEYIQKLLANQTAYYCFCTPERLDELRKKQELKKMVTHYDRHCVALDAETIAAKLKAGERHVVRMKMPKEGETMFHDMVRGEINFANKLIDDQILIKSDGFPTYHFAVVVDDHLMNITHVIRGEEWISSTPKHIKLYEFFGWEPPQFAHLPLLLNPDKSKLSKRQGDVAVEDYRKKGYVPEAIINFVAFLGWNPGTDKELFTLDELIKEFSIERVNKSGAVFNLEKLDWYNREYIKKLSTTEVIDRAKPFLEEAGLIAWQKAQGKNQAWLESVVNLEKERITTLADLPEAIKFVVELPEYSKELLVWKKGTMEEVQKVLPELKIMLDTISVQSFTHKNLEETIKQWIGDKGFSVGSVLWPLRVSLSGQQNSPGPFEIAEVLGKEEVLSRLDIALHKVGVV